MSDKKKLSEDIVAGVRELEAELASVREELRYTKEAKSAALVNAERERDALVAKLAQVRAWGERWDGDDTSLFAILDGTSGTSKMVAEPLHDQCNSHCTRPRLGAANSEDMLEAALAEARKEGMQIAAEDIQAAVAGHPDGSPWCDECKYMYRVIDTYGRKHNLKGFES